MPNSTGTAPAPAIPVAGPASVEPAKPLTPRNWNAAAYPRGSRGLVRLRWWVQPTRSFWLLFLVLLAMWYAAISQANSVAYLIAFTIGSMTLVSVLHSMFSLRRLEVDPGPAQPVHSGEVLRQVLHVRNVSSRAKLGLQLGFPVRRGWHDSVPEALDYLPPDGKCEITLSTAIEARGRHPLDGLVVQTTFPLGVLRLSHWLPLEGEVLVYPRGSGNLPRPYGLAEDQFYHQEQESGLQREGDNYSGLRTYRLGDSQRHVDWKAVARGQPMLVKEFTGSGERQIWLDWGAEELQGLGTEARIGQLARWVAEAEAESLDYGLRLPGKELTPALGVAHYHRCMAALALHPRDTDEPLPVMAPRRRKAKRRPSNQPHPDT